MAPAFSKEAILTGVVDYLCLVCENYLKNELDVAIHVAQPSHRKNLGYITSIEKYRGDRVKQIKRWYFCELCNVLLHSQKKIDLHIADAKHVESKSSQSPRRAGDAVVVSGVAIPDESWHGLVDRSCVLCDVDFDDTEAHKRDANHVVKLIQSGIIDVNNNIYREMADSVFHCLICNKMVAAITAHFDDVQHKEHLQKCREAKINEDDENSNKTGLKSNKQHKELTTENKDLDTTDILNNISHFQTNGININFESLTAVCKKCSIHLEFNNRAMESHIREHESEQKIKKAHTPGNFDETKENKVSDNNTLFTSPVFLKLSENNNNKGTTDTKSTECARKIKGDDIKEKKKDEPEQVDVRHKMADNSNKIGKISEVDNNLKKHDATNNNNGNVKSKNSKRNDSKDSITKDSSSKRCNLQKVPSRVFINKMTGIADKNQGSECVYVIFNDAYCIHSFSFLLLRIIGSRRWKCLLCQVDVYHGHLDRHIKEEKHINMLTDLPVVVHSSEFIREINSGSFHCGYCNAVETSWLGMEEHLKSTAHRESKAAASWRLMEVSSELQKDVTAHHNEIDFFNQIRLNC